MHQWLLKPRPSPIISHSVHAERSHNYTVHPKGYNLDQWKGNKREV